MRLDKFLKVSRLVKRRTMANALCTGGGVSINGKVAKPSTEVEVGDEMVLHLGNRQLSVRVEAVPAKPVPAQSASELYTVVYDNYNDASRDTV